MSLNVFEKLKLKAFPDRPLTDWESSLMNQNFLNETTDLAKLLFVLKQCITPEEWPDETKKDAPTIRDFTINKIKENFEGSAEAATDISFDMAIEYGFIRIETDPNTGLKKYVETPKSELDCSHDWFCFECDKMVEKKNRQFLECDYCHRVYHRKCSQEFHTVKDFKCRYCVVVEEQSEGYINEYQTVDQKRLNRLIGFLLDFVKIRMKGKFEEIDLQFEENDYIFVFKKMNLSLMGQKVERMEYKKLSEFDDDFFYYMHNLHITQIYFYVHEVIQNFIDLRTFMLKERVELHKCVDCYERANDKALHELNKEWFCIPCHPIHEPVFVKLKALPYWPSKVILRSKDAKKVEVCFFEAEKVKDKSKGISPTFWKSEVKPSEIKDITDNEVLNQIKGNQRLIKPMELMVKYLEQLPNNKKYQKTIEIIKENNKRSPKGANSQSIEDSIGDSIESVVKGLKTPVGRPSKNQRNKESKSMSKLPITQSKSRQKKKASTPQSSSDSTRSSSPVIPVLPKQVFDEMNDSVDSLSNGVTDMNVSESAQPPPLKSPNDSYADEDSRTDDPNTAKRRSGRIAALTPPQKTDTKKKSDAKSLKKLKRKEKQNKSFDESERMEVDREDGEDCNQTNKTNQTNVSFTESLRNNDSQTVNPVNQSSQSVPIIVDTSEQLIHLNEFQDLNQSSKLNSNTNWEPLTSEGRPQSNKAKDFNPNIVNKSETFELINLKTPLNTIKVNHSFENKSFPITTTAVITPSMTSTSQSSIVNQTIVTQHPTLSQPVPLEVDTQTQTFSTPLKTSPPITPMPSTSFSGTDIQKENLKPNIGFNQNQSTDASSVDPFFHLNRLTDDLKKMKVTTGPQFEFDQKIILIKHFHSELTEKINSLENINNELKNGLKEAKSKNWCVVCLKEANHYCCIRFYCSRECQAVDWRNGHHSQCLDNEK